MVLEHSDNESERIYMPMDDLTGENIRTLNEEINRFIKNDSRDIVIDLVHVTRIDSMSLAAILRLKNLLKQDGRNLNLTNPGPNVVKILEISGLDSILLD